MWLKMLPLVIFLGLLSINQARALNGGHYVFSGDNRAGTQVSFSAVHQGENPSGKVYPSNRVVFEKPDGTPVWDSNCLSMRGSLRYKGGWDDSAVQYIVAWTFDASNITNFDHNDSNMGTEVSNTEGERAGLLLES